MNRTLVIILGVFFLVICICLIAVGSWFVVYVPQNTVKGSGNTTTETRQLGSFKNIDSNGDFNITLSDTQLENLEINAEDNILTKIVTEIRGDTLYLYYKKNFIFPIYITNTKPVNITINYKNIKDITINGLATLSQTENSKIREDEFNLKVTGLAKVSLNIFVKTFNVNVDGNSILGISGSANTQNIDINGLSKYFAKDLESNEVSLKTIGGSDIEIRANEKLDINIDGNTNVRYFGTPKKLNQNINGTGKVVQGNI